MPARSQCLRGAREPGEQFVGVTQAFQDWEGVTAPCVIGLDAWF